MSGAGAGDGRGQAGGDGGSGLLRGHGSGLAGDSSGLSSDGFRLASHDTEGVCLSQVLSGRVVNSLLGWLAYVVLLVVWYDVLGSAYLDRGTALGAGQGDGREGSEDNRETHFDGLEIIR